MNTKSFTLIEILVALVILGILSTFIIVSLNSVVDSANDAKRKKDLDSISKMLMTYRILNGSYPDESGIIETALSDLIPDYTTSFPKDPSGLSYNYSSDGETYTLTSQTLSYNSEDGFAEGGGSGPWLTGYSYRKEITLSNSGSELTDYQLKFTINRTAGTDSGFTTYLGTKCLDNYNDIRFTDSSHQVLSYWIESSNSSIATVWVKADTLVGSGNTTLYLYYGNNEAINASSASETMIFYEDWSGSISTQWDQYTKSSSFTLPGGNILRNTASSSSHCGGNLTSKTSFPSTKDYIIETTTKKNSYYSTATGAINGFSNKTS